MITERNVTLPARHPNQQGYRLYTIESGSGVPVIFLHGFAVSCEYWRPTLELLGCRGYRAIAVDVLGFGQSEKPPDAPYSLHLYAETFAGLLDALEIEQAFFVGHSFGGKLALATAILYPQRVCGLVAMDTDGFLSVPTFMRKVTSLPKFGEFFLWLAARESIVRAQLNMSFYNPKPYVSPEMIVRGRDALMLAENRAVLIQMSHHKDEIDLGGSGLRKRVGEIRCPTLVVWGGNDRVIAPRCGETARREIPGAKLVVFPNCGHFPHVEAFREFHGLLLGFLAGAAHTSDECG
jgi:pimeloyl-ACP methyl ester carboxylesterase